MGADEIHRIAIIGANLAGGRAAEALRSAGYDGEIVLIGEERIAPHERPPLSKDVLVNKGEKPEGFFLNSDDFYQSNRIDIRLGVRAEKLSTANRSVVLSTGEEIAFDRAILCTGARARKINCPGANLENVFYLRTLEDAKALLGVLKPGARLGLIGMGVIGAEVAASVRKIGCEVFAVEPQEVPMARGLGERFGAWLSRIHAEEGVHLRLGVGVEKIIGANDKAAGLLLTDGSAVDVDAVLVGIGVIPNTEIVKGTGVEINNGIVVNEFAQTTAPEIYAAGDVAFAPQISGSMARVETYQNAQDQAVTAVRSLLGDSDPYLQPQWFWTDQYDMNIQVIGDVVTTDGVSIVVRGDPDSRCFSAFWLQECRLKGAMTVNTPKDMSSARRMLQRDLPLNANLLADCQTPLREILRNAK